MMWEDVLQMYTIDLCFELAVCFVGRCGKNQKEIVLKPLLQLQILGGVPFG